MPTSSQRRPLLGGRVDLAIAQHLPRGRHQAGAAAAKPLADRRCSLQCGEAALEPVGGNDDAHLRSDLRPAGQVAWPRLRDDQARAVVGGQNALRSRTGVGGAAGTARIRSPSRPSNPTVAEAATTLCMVTMMPAAPPTAWAATTISGLTPIWPAVEFEELADRA